MAMNQAQVTELRRRLGKAVLDIQTGYSSVYKPREFIPQMIAALLSLASYISKNNAGLSRQGFMDVCDAAASENFDNPSKEARGPLGIILPN